MAFNLSFKNMTTEEQTTALELLQKIKALEGAIADISDLKAIADAGYRKKENYLKTELGKLEIELRTLRTATITETE